VIRRLVTLCDLECLYGDGDLLVDCLCFTAGHARGLLSLLDDVGVLVMISSKAVYVDAAGKRETCVSVAGRTAVSRTMESWRDWFVGLRPA
jgi:hypothetical protein